MSTAGLFAMGVFVTLIVSAGLSLLVYGAILDGRDEARRKAAESEQPRRDTRPGRRPGVETASHNEAKEAVMQNIIETAREAGSFTTLLTAVDTAGLGASGVAAAAYGMHAGRSRRELGVLAALTPVYAVGHGIGMWRGLFELLR